MKASVTAGCLLLALCGSSMAQTSNLVPLREAFVNCVWAAAMDSPYFISQRHLAVETAFDACRTEEQAISAHFRARELDMNMLAVSLSKLRSSIKQQILTHTAR